MIPRRIAVALSIVLLGSAFLAGYWPEHRRNQALELSRARLETDLAASRAQLGVARLLGDLLNLTDLVSQMDYGQARAMSSRFFDDVRAVAEANSEARFKDALGAILAQRDSVTAGLTRADAATLATLGDMQRRLRTSLGYPVPTVPPPAAPGK